MRFTSLFSFFFVIKISFTFKIASLLIDIFLSLHWLLLSFPFSGRNGVAWINWHHLKMKEKFRFAWISRSIFILLCLHAMGFDPRPSSMIVNLNQRNKVIIHCTAFFVCIQQCLGNFNFQLAEIISAIIKSGSILENVIRNRLWMPVWSKRRKINFSLALSVKVIRFFTAAFSTAWRPSQLYKVSKNTLILGDAFPTSICCFCISFSGLKSMETWLACGTMVFVLCIQRNAIMRKLKNR